MSLFLLAKTVTSIPKPKRSHLIYMTMKRQKKVSLVFVVLDTVLDELRIKLYVRKFYSFCFLHRQITLCNRVCLHKLKDSELSSKK